MPAAAAIHTLIVDDQASMRALIRTSLQQMGFREFREAADGEVGLREMITRPAHLVISDFNMPNLDGLGLLRAVRAHPPTAGAAFIMLTGRADRELVARGAVRGQQLSGQAVHSRSTAREGRRRVRGADMTAALLEPMQKIHVGQGEHYVTRDPETMLTTILGSCVAMCLRDPSVGVGGMNHFLLPEGAGSGTDAGRRYGAYAMEVLINDCLKSGARRDRLEAKLFGGGRMFDTLKDVGVANADFAEKFLRDEGIAMVGGSLRGMGGRRVQYWPATGRALQRAVTDGHQPTPPTRPRPASTTDAGALELF